MRGWWWILALPVPAGAGITAGTVTAYASAGAITAVEIIGVASTSVVAAAHAIPLASIALGVAVGGAVFTISASLIAKGIRYFSKKKLKPHKD